MLRSPTPPSSGRAFTGSLSRSRVVRIKRYGRGDQQRQEKHSIINDENDRRLSNGNVGGCTTLSVGHDIVDSGSGSGGKPLRPPSPASQSWSPPGVLSLANPPCEDHRSLVGAVNECGGSGGSEDGGGESWGSTSSSTALGSPWHHVVRGSDDLGEELISFVSETRILSPAVSSVLSRVSSVTTEGNSGIEEGGVGEEVNDNHDTPPDIDVDGDGGGDDDGVTRAVEGKGSGVTEKNQQGGSGGSGGGDSGSTDSISVGNIAGLNGSRAGRLTSRRDPVAKSQRLQPQSTKQVSDQPMERTRWGGWREAGTGTSAAAEASCRSSSRAIVAAKVGGRRKNVVGTSGGTGGEKPRNEQCMTVVKSSKGPCTSSDTTGTITKSREPKTRIPSTPSSKKPLATSSTTTPTTTIATTSRSKKKQQQQQRRSKWAVKPNEPRQPPCKPTDTPKARIPQRTKGGKMNTKSKLSRPKGTASGEERSGGGGTGGDGSRGDVSGGAASGGARSSRSKRPTPRVSASRHMAWERTLRTTTTMPSSTKGKSPPGKKDTLQGAMCTAGKGDGDGGDKEDGRPSVGAWTTAQRMLQTLKELTGTDDEELQWLAVAKEGKGVETSEKRQESAETEYHRLLCQESVQQAGLKLIKDRRLEVALKVFGKLGIELERVTELLEELREKEMTLIAEDEEAEHQASMEVDEAVAKAPTAELEATEAGASLENDEAVTAAGTAVEAAVSAAETSRASRHAQRENLEQERGEQEEKLRSLLEDIAIAREKLGALGAVLKEECREVPSGCGSALETVVGITADVCSARELIAPARAKSGLRSLEGAAKTLAEELNKTRSDSQSALVRMEKWRERKEALPEYAKELADKEKAWSEREAAANEEALRHTRALVPVGVTGLTVAQLEQRAIEAGSLYPRELALRLKENRLLHWVVTHQDDIARSNFLRGDHAHFFTNLDQYDLVELRAVLACLPDKFEVDADGRKAAWRAAFMQRVQGLVAQERRETVSGGWDPELQARRQVQLPKLTAEQTRRKEYYYPTVAEVEQKVEKFHERQRRLEAKQAKLAQVKDDLLPEAKEEYVNVLEDTRHPANKEAFKPEDLRRARDEAKAEVERLSKEARRLEADVASAQRALRESPYTAESLQAEAEATHRLLTERARKTRVQASSQEAEEEMEVGEGLEVQGGFDQTPELKSRFADKISSLRFVTAEEDARMRKEELASVFAARNKTVAAADEGEEPSSLKTAVREASEESSGSNGEGEQGNARAGDSAATGDAGEEQEINKERMKAFGAILEKTLSQTMLGRAPLSGIAAGAAVSAGVGPAAGGKTRMMPPTRPQQQQQKQQQSENKGPAIVTPLCQPKSKFFRSIRSPPAASQVDGNGSGTAGGMGRPLVPPSPAPAPLMGLLAQIRGAKGGHGDGSGVVGEKGADDSMLGTGADSGTAPLPLPLPQPPASSLPPRSLFAAAGPSAVAVASVQAPQPDFLAQLRAKAAEKQALRRAAEEETGIN